MIVEFVGLPGAGKSITAEELARECGGQFVRRDYPPVGRILWRLKWVGATPAKRNRLAHQKIDRLRWQIDTYPDRPDGVVVLEEGPIHTCAELAGLGLPEDRVVDVSRWVPVPDLLVEVVADWKVRYGRLRARGDRHWLVSRFSLEQAASYEQGYLEYLHRPIAARVVVDGEAPVVDSVRMIAAELPVQA